MTTGKRIGFWLASALVPLGAAVGLEEPDAAGPPLEGPPVPADGRWEVTVTFDSPGTYVLRGRADDGALYHDQDITIIVAPVTTPQ